MANKWTREKIILPKTLKPKERKQIAEVVINHIINRTTAGYKINEKDKFPKYTNSYAEIKGVGTSEVDLLLSGEMLEAIELVSDKAGEIVIGYKNPSDELAGKVEGNRTGSYGGEPNARKARDFLGIDPGTLDTLISSYQDDEALGSVTKEDLDALSRELAMDLLDDT
jgi:hypothetical protein